MSKEVSKPIEGKVVGHIGEATYYEVGGRGWGKSQAQREMAAQAGLYILDEAARLRREAPTVADLQNAIPLEGVREIDFSLGPVDVSEPAYSATNYTAQMSFTALYPHMFENFRVAGEDARERRLAEQAGYATWEEWINASLPWQQEFIKGRVVCHWDYPPAEELMHRLNTRLQGKDPGLPVNTRYWRDQK